MFILKFSARRLLRIKFLKYAFYDNDLTENYFAQQNYFREPLLYGAVNQRFFGGFFMVKRGSVQ